MIEHVISCGCSRFRLTGTQSRVHASTLPNVHTYNLIGEDASFDSSLHTSS